jgi:hypothetical protein
MDEVSGESTKPMPVLVFYDQQQVDTMLRTWSSSRLHTALDEQTFGGTLALAERAALLHLLDDWKMRALGAVMLRDALLVDPQRGQRVYTLLCCALIYEQHPLTPDLGSWLAPWYGQLLTDSLMQDIRHKIDQELGLNSATIPREWVKLAGLLQRAEQAGWGGVVCAGTPHDCSFPLPDLESLLPPPPAATPPTATVAHTTRWRRVVLGGLSLLGILVFVGLVLHRWKCCRGTKTL